MPTVRLREVTKEDAALLERWELPPNRGEFNIFWTAPRDLDAILRDRKVATGEGGTMIVESTEDGAPIGTVSWRAVKYGPNPQSLAWNIGINLVPEARGRGFGFEAQRLLAERLFATTTANRVEAMTDVMNVAEQRSLERAGFQREGVLRGAQYRAGAWHDLAVYSLLREPLSARRTPP